MCRHTSDDQPATRIACVLSRADRHDTPDNIADSVGEQQGAGLVDHHADRTPVGMPVLTDESGQYILRCTCSSSIGEWLYHHLLTSGPSPFPCPVQVEEGPTAIHRLQLLPLFYCQRK